MSRPRLHDIAENLILARLLVPGARPPAPLAVEKHVTALFDKRLSQAEGRDLFVRALEGLVAAQLATAKPLALTAAGRARAMAFWQIDQLPSRLSWNTLKRQFLTPRALGFSRRQLAGKDKTKALVAAVVKSRYGLPAEVGATATAVVSALAWQQLDIVSTARFTPQAVVGQALLQSARPLSADDLTRQLAKLALDTTGNDLVAGALRQWIGTAVEDAAAAHGGPSPGGESHPADNNGSLAGFAEAASHAARQSRTGRFGENKVFIAQVWRELHSHREFGALSLAAFKERLIEAHRLRLLELSRADLVERMDPREVAESETGYLGATFHFVRIT